MKFTCMASMGRLALALGAWVAFLCVSVSAAPVAYSGKLTGWRAESGTVMVKDFNPAGSSSPQDFILMGNSLFFTAVDFEGRELWEIDIGQ